ncbi:MAG: DUF523 and DUF1722 domain-containing protein [Pseudomonadales bacterium]|nr:DUF523 and DUF1722 domain-containing protein [Pseudomonadales bacterium]
MKSNNPETSITKIPVGISECLLGSAVRYNGGHKHSKLCTKELSGYFDFVPTCPEVSIGLGVPREPIRLVNIDGETRVRGSDDPSIDVTDALKEHAHEYQQKNQQIAGFIFTQNSPSCGLNPVKVYHKNGNPLGKDQGAFAKAIVKHAPYLPTEEAGRLNDPLLRETFVTAVYTYHDWLENVANTDKKRALVEFHARNKYRLMSHSIQGYKNLGNLVANLKDKRFEELKSEYLLEFMATIKSPTSKGLHCNTLEHVQGYLKKRITAREKAQLHDSIEHYRKGYVPLVVPITLLNHYTKIHFSPNAYIRNQTYLQPHPLELGLHNGI